MLGTGRKHLFTTSKCTATYELSAMRALTRAGKENCFVVAYVETGKKNMN
jgi:hypothetical protein